jgi:hypothetical protein
MRIIALLAALSLGPSLNQENGGAVEGTISLKGTVEIVKRKPIKISCPHCAPLYPNGMPREEILLDANRRVQGAFVTIKSGLEGRKFDIPKTPVLIEQKECRYEPHVVGLQVGQELVFRNSDPHDHCIHALPFNSREFLFGQPKGCKDIAKTLDRPEVMVKIKDDVHVWMSAWVGVVDHPYFAVTDPSGHYRIKDLPPGRYTIEVWHELFKSVIREIEITGKDAKTVNVELSEKKG